MTVSDPAKLAPRSLAGDLFYATRYYLSGRIGLIAIAAAALGLGAYFNWGWLVAAGIARILLTALPCAAMCALGLCMGRKTMNQTDEPASTRSSPDEPVLRLGASLDENQDVTGASDQSTRTASRNRKDCC
jgi:hypothetical protein